MNTITTPYNTLLNANGHLLESTMNAKTKAAKLVERLIRAEHTESMRADARRCIRDERMKLQSAMSMNVWACPIDDSGETSDELQLHVAAKENGIARQMAEAIRVAEMWGVEL